MSDHTLSETLAERPRLIGAVFTLLLLYASTQPVLGGGATAYPGP